LIKPDAPGEPIRESSMKVATYVLYQILKLMHPFTPFVTEEIYRQLAGGESGTDEPPTLTFGPWPKADSKYVDDELEGSLTQIQEVVTAVRSVRSELNVPPGKKSDLYIRVNDEAFGKLLDDHITYFRSLARVENLHCGVDVKKPALSASAVISGAEIFVPLEGLIDIDVERKRLQKELDNLKTQLTKVSKKLANPDFLANAPSDVIDREKLKKSDYEERIERINKNLEHILGW
jgi:valyl-tRNA synthetase